MEGGIGTSNFAYYYKLDKGVTYFFAAAVTARDQASLYMSRRDWLKKKHVSGSKNTLG